MQKDIEHILNRAFSQYHRFDYIQDDPISLPHQFSKLQDIEIIAFWVAILAWGNRKSIINSGKRLIRLMDNAPHDFIIHHKEKDRSRFLDFRHRTFQPDDALYFLEFLQNYYKKNNSLQSAFYSGMAQSGDLRDGLIQFKKTFFAAEHLRRTEKHISSPITGSACKRLNMFLRWMVRTSSVVDFGIWKKIKPAQLMIPLDVHVHRIALKLGLTQSKQANWKTLTQIMDILRKLDPDDPAKYDFALFGLAVSPQDGAQG